MRALHVLVGTGGFGKEVMPFLLEGRLKSYVVFADKNPQHVDLHGVSVYSMDRVAEELRSGRPVWFNVAVGDSVARKEVASWFLERNGWAEAIVSSKANIQPYVKIGRGAVLCPFVTVNASAEIGEFLQANIYSYVAHDCRVGDYVTLAPGAKVNGKCVLGDHVYVGTGAVLLPGVKVDAHAVIGAGAVVLSDVQRGAVVVGNPAKFLRYLPGFDPIGYAPIGHGG